jgi:cob(I)alamin adenosyltransferase
MKIYTRKGDKGQTSLIGRSGVDKDSPRIEAYGTVDELNAVLGLAVLSVVTSSIKALLVQIQNELFALGADLAQVGTGRRFRIGEAEWQDLESKIDRYEEELTALHHFVLPGGSPGAALLHFARTVCRRAERLTVKAFKGDPTLNPESLIYLNRLSDLLFVLARFENMQAGEKELTWRGDR